MCMRDGQCLYINGIIFLVAMSVSGATSFKKWPIGMEVTTAAANGKQVCAASWEKRNVTSGDHIDKRTIVEEK